MNTSIIHFLEIYWSINKGFQSTPPPFSHFFLNLWSCKPNQHPRSLLFLPLTIYLPFFSFSLSISLSISLLFSPPYSSSYLSRVTWWRTVTPLSDFVLGSPFWSNRVNTVMKRETKHWRLTYCLLQPGRPCVRSMGMRDFKSQQVNKIINGCVVSYLHSHCLECSVKCC